MKTDPFDDAIRRKLDGVNPPFQEKNWTQFQRFMGSQGFPPSLWQSPAHWLQPALTAAAVAGVVVASVWQYRSNQALTAQMQTLTKTVQRLEQAQIRVQQSATATDKPPRVDTVYLTQRIGSGTLPDDRSGMSTNASATGTYAIRPDQYAASATPTDQSSRATPLPPTATQPNQPTATANTHRNVPVDETAVVALQPMERLGRQPKFRQRTTDQPINQPSSTQANGSILYSNSVNNSAAAGRNVLDGAASAGNTNVPERPTAGPPTAPSVLANLQLLTPLPLPDQSAALAESWQRHLRRVRFGPSYTQQSLVASAAVPTKNATPIPVEWRLGLGGDVGAIQAGFGAYAEAIIANRWKISVGVGEMNWSGDTYSTEQQFKVKTKHDFRRYYPVSGPPLPTVIAQRREVENITRSGQAVEIPVQVGYRIGLGNQYAFTPTVGVNFSIDPHESITYTIGYQTIREDYWQNISIGRPVNRYSNWTLGFGLERQWSRFAGQLNPVVLAPLSGADVGLNKLSVGVGARLFYRL